MRHRLALLEPNELGLYVHYGWDPFAGFFGELRSDDEEEPIAQYGELAGDYDQAEPLRGLLDWLVMVGALTGTGLDEALASTMSPAPSRLSRAGARALRVTCTLKRAAD